MSIRISEAVASRMGITLKTMRLYAANDLLGELGMSAKTAAAVRKELGFDQEHLSISTPATTSKKVERDPDGWEAGRRVAGWELMDFLEREAIMAAWDGVGQLNHSEVCKILQASPFVK